MVFNNRMRKMVMKDKRSELENIDGEVIVKLNKRDFLLLANTYVEYHQDKFDTDAEIGKQLNVRRMQLKLELEELDSRIKKQEE